MNERRRRPASLEEARSADVPADLDREPPATPEPPETLEEVAHWCLGCTEPGTIGPDSTGSYMCADCDAKRTARLARMHAQIGGRLPLRSIDDMAPRTTSRDLSDVLDRIGGRIRHQPPPERMPYRDEFDDE